MSNHANLFELALLLNRLEEAEITTERFLKVKKDKAAFENDWPNNPYDVADLTTYPRWGIIGGDELVPVEADKPEMAKIIRNILPPTLEITSPRRRLPHFYFKVVGGKVQNKILHILGDSEGAGEIRASNQYVVTAGTEIEFEDLITGELRRGTYRITANRPIATISYNDFMQKIKPYLGTKSEQHLTEEIIDNGAKKGTRHSYGIKYAIRLIRYEKLDPVAAREILGRWNQKCQPPMSEADLDRMIKNAVKYAYEDADEKTQERIVFGDGFYLQKSGNDVFLFNKEGESLDCCKSWHASGQKFREKIKSIAALDDEDVDRAIAQFQLSQAPQKNNSQPMPEAEIQEQLETYDQRTLLEAEDLAKHENLLDAIAPHLDNLIAGEEDNKKMVFVLLLSGLLNNSSLKQIILLKGEAGGGKTTLMKLAKLFTTKHVGRFTAHALDYSNLEDYDVLLIQELGYMDVENAEHGISTLKFLSADDEGFTVEFTGRNDDGSFHTETKRISPITVILSTTRVDVERQFERRGWILGPDESAEQTEKIRQWQNKADKEKQLVDCRLLSETSEKHSMNVLKSFLSSLKDVPIIFPFGPTVTAFLPQDRLRVRGDFTKLASLIKLYAFANQHKLPRLKGTKSEVEPIVVTPEIVMQILPLGLKLMASMQVGLENRSLKLLDFLKKCELKKEWDLEQRRLDETPRFGTDEVFAVTSDMINEMARALGKSRKQILRYLKQWCDAGLMAPAERAYSSQPHEYILLHSISETERRLKKLTNEPESEIRAKLTIEGREFLKPILNEIFDETGEENLDIIEAFR